MPAPPAPRRLRRRGKRVWRVLVLTRLMPASLDVVAHARALAGSRGSVTVRPFRPVALLEDARDALAQDAFRVVLVAMDDVGAAGARNLAEELRDAGLLLLVLCPPGAPPRAV